MENSFFDRLLIEAQELATKIWFKSKTPVKAIAINNFPYWYKVKRVSLYHYEIECKKMQNYFDQTDVIEIIVKK